MKRTLLLLAALLCLAVADTSVRTVSGADKEKSVEAPYVHTVIFYLKKDAPKDEAKALIADAHELLAKVPTVRTLRIGAPAEKATPNLAVTDYQVGLMILFDNYDGLKTYIDHPLHVKYVDRHIKNIDKVLVYDFINQAK